MGAGVALVLLVSKVEKKFQGFYMLPFPGTSLPLFFAIVLWSENHRIYLLQLCENCDFS